MLEVNKENFEKEVLKSKKPVLADFFADWCAPCKLLAPIFEELSKEMKNIKFVKIDIEKNQELALKYGIRSIPNLILFEKGKVKNQLIGLVSKEQLQQFTKDNTQ